MIRTATIIYVFLFPLVHNQYYYNIDYGDIIIIIKVKDFFTILIDWRSVSSVARFIFLHFILPGIL
jgi:uncharacterized membrane protein